MNFQGFLKQSTAVTVTVLMIDSSDHLTGKTGLAAGLTVYQSKAGAATGAITPTSVTELDATNAKGLYALALNTTTWTNTLGEMILHITATGADPADYKWWITARLPDDLAFPATTGRSMVVDASGLCDSNMVKAGPTGSGTAQTAGDIYSKVSGLTFTVATKLDTNVYTWNGTAVSAPATAGIPEVNVKNMNNVSAASITAINANQGTTQPVNFHGTAGSAYVKSDLVEISDAAVSATTAQLGVNVVNWNNTVVATPATAGIPDVNTKNWNNLVTVALPLVPTVAGRSLDVSATGEAGVDWANVGSPTTTLALTGTTIGTLTTYTGNTPQTGDAYARLGAPAGASVSADVAAVKVDTAAVKVQTDKMTFTVANKMDSNVYTWNGTAVTAPNTAGTPVVDVGRINNVVTTPVTTIKAVQGLTTADTVAVATALTAAERNAIADALLARNVAGGSSAGRIVKDAIASLRNKVAISAGTLTVYDVDDTTPLWDATVTTAAGNPLASIDPS